MIRTDTMDVAVFRTRDDQVFALRDACPHKGGPLSTGYRARHLGDLPAAQLEDRPGLRRSPGPRRGLHQRFATKVEGGRVLLALKADVAAA